MLILRKGGRRALRGEARTAKRSHPKRDGSFAEFEATDQRLLNFKDLVLSLPNIR